MRIFATIAAEFQKQGINALVIEEDVLDTKGFFLYAHESLEEAPSFDHWFETLEKAYSVARRDWGVEEADWLNLPS